ncbi:MAG: DNA primase [Dictyoglomus sp. NZ13-RE01]|nr:MAG: DNA primase [Dictyoglomus sp. NZ13-RE01]
MALSLEDFVDEVKERVNIVDVISKYVNLKRVGKNFAGLCPFHNEKTPSFYVSPEKGLYHCFGCGASGDVFTFLMNYKNISFMSALEELANEVGLELPKKEEKREKYDVHLEIIKSTAEFYHLFLSSKFGKEGKEYLKKRNIKEKTQEDFLLGFAPKNPQLLYKYLIKKGFSEEDIIKSKVLFYSNGEWRDLFAGRVTFPIINHRGKIVGFGARTLGNDEPKYINSPESDIFNKREILYALYHGKEKIKKDGKAILVEGYMDAISLHQEGINIAVASLGTSLTHSQAKLLKNYTNNVIIAYDKDVAGIQAGKRALSIFELEGMNVFWLDLPQGYKDPDEYIQKNDKEKFIKLLNNSRQALEFLIDHTLNEEMPLQEKIENLLEILTSSILRSKNILIQQEKVKGYIPYICKKLNVSENIFQKVLKTRILQEQRNYQAEKKAEIIKVLGLSQLEEILLGFILLGVEEFNIKSLSPDDFTFPFFQEVIRKWRVWENKSNLEEFINLWDEDKRDFLRRAIKLAEINRNELSYILDRFREEQIKKQIRLRKEELARLEKDTYTEEELEYIIEIKKEIQWLISQLKRVQ